MEGTDPSSVSLDDPNKRHLVAEVSTKVGVADMMYAFARNFKVVVRDYTKISLLKITSHKFN